MRIADANVLLYATNPDTPGHDRSKAWVEDALSGREAVGLPWVTLLAFLRLSTRTGVFARPLTVEEATGEVSRWLARTACVIPEPTARHGAVLTGLLRDVGTAGNLVTDAHLAALAVEHDATIVTWDNDFRRFTGVRVIQP